MRPLLAVALLMSCGNLDSGSARGDPIYVMRAEMEGEEIQPPEGVHRAIFGWTSFGEGAYFDCLEESEVPLLFCARIPDQAFNFTLFHTDVVPRFPSGFDIPFDNFPKREQLLSRNGAVLAMGGMAIYDDRNLNGDLDPIRPEDPEPIDQVVAESIIKAVQDLDFPLVVSIFREGPVHPMWRVFASAYDCPEPPTGISIARVEESGASYRCTVRRRGDALRVTASTEDATARARCGGGAVLTDVAGVFRGGEPTMPIPDGSVYDCAQDGRSLSFYRDDGNFCDQFNSTELRLKGCRAASDCWDFTDMPPEFWPCQP